MSIIDEIAINSNRCNSCISKLETASFLTRLFDKYDSFSNRIRDIYSKGNEISIEIKNMQDSIARTDRLMQYNATVDPSIASILSRTPINGNFLAPINIPQVSTTEARTSLNNLNIQLDNLRNQLPNKMKDYEKLIIDLRKYRTRVFNFGDLKGFPTIDELPIVINLANINIF